MKKREGFLFRLHFQFTFIHKELSVYSSGSVIQLLDWKVSFIFHSHSVKKGIGLRFRRLDCQEKESISSVVYRSRIVRE